MERFKALSSVTLFLIKEDGGKTEILLQKRKGSVMLSGMWDGSASGHVEEGESMTQCMIREAKEELGIEVSRENIIHIVCQHSKSNDVVYYNSYYFVKNWRGEPQICEPEKCGEIKWYEINTLPDSFMKNKQQAVAAFIKNAHYIEFGW